MHGRVMGVACICEYIYVYTHISTGNTTTLKEERFGERTQHRDQRTVRYRQGTSFLTLRQEMRFRVQG